MITLHESKITSFPQDNGLGVLNDAVKAHAEEELNGFFEFYMEYDSESHLVDELKEERIIKAKAQDKLGYQLFRIYSITKNHLNDNLIVRARHITYDLADNFVEELIANDLTKRQVMEKIGSSTVLQHTFNLTSSNNTTRSSTRLYRTNPLQMIAGMQGSILQKWGGQIERDNFNLVLHDRRGSDDGVKVTYEKNITGLEATFDISNLGTRIFPFVYDEERDRLITTSNRYIDSQRINDYSKIYYRPIDLTYDERIDLDGTYAEIRQQIESITNNYFEETNIDQAKVDMEVQFEHLWETEEYKDLSVLELVGLGDTVTIEHSRLKINTTAIVNYIRYDCIAHVNEEVRLGSVKARLTDSVNRVIDVAEKVEQVEQTANQAIKTADGKNTIYYGPDEPTEGKDGDLWFRVVDGDYTRTYRHDGIQWQLVLSVDVRDAMDDAQQAKDNAQQAVDTANQASQDATDAINQAQTAFDDAQSALSTATNAIGIADSAFSLANDAFSEVESLSTIVDKNTGEISTIKQSVIGLQTQVSDNAGNISSLTQIAQGLQTQVTDIEGNVSTLQQTAQGLQSSVTNLQNELDGLEIGGRNLLEGNWDLTWEDSHPSYQYLLRPQIQSITDKVSIGDTLTFSFDVEAEADTSLRVYDSNGHPGISFGSQVINVKQGKQRVSFTKTLVAGSQNTEIWYMDVYNNNNGVKFSISKIKIEKGNKATDWSPAPEDIDHQFSEITQTIDSVTTRVGDAEGNITTLQQTSQSLAGRLTDAEGNITTLTATVDGIQTQVTDIDGNVSTVTQLANALQVRMTDAEGNISTLTQTASSLQSQITNLDSDVQSQFTQLSDAINLRVEKDDVINQINISDESILIAGNKIHITGQTTIDNAAIKSAHIQSLDAGKLTTGILDVGLLTVLNLTFDHSSGGTLTLGGANDSFGRMQVLDDEGEIIADLDAEYGGFSNLTIGNLEVTQNINAPNIIKETTEDITLYVVGEIGSDDNDGGAANSSRGLYSIQEAINRLPKVINHNVEIRLGYGFEMRELISIDGFTGSGHITINFVYGINVLDGYIRVRNCDIRVVIQNGRIQRSGGEVYIIDNQSSKYVFVENMILNGDGHSYGIRTWRGGVTNIDNTAIYNVENCVYVNQLSRAYVNGCRGLGSIRGVWAQSGSIVHFNGTSPVGNTSNYTIGGSSLRVGTPTSYDSGTATPPSQPTTEITQTWTATNSGTYNMGTGSWSQYFGNRVVQGRYNNTPIHRGFWFFGSAMRNAVRNKTIKRIRIRPTRRNGSGISGNVPVVFRAHTYSSRPTSGTPTLSSTNHSADFKWGERKWVTLPTSFHSLFSGGSYYGIGIQTPNNTNSHYAVMEGNLEVEITYES